VDIRYPEAVIRAPDPWATTGKRRVATAVESLCVLLVAAGIFAFHARWIFGHFSNDGYLCDSGWIAFLFEDADPLLRNPRSVVGHACAGVNASTFLAHHLSPHIFLFGAPFAAWGGVRHRHPGVPPGVLLWAFLRCAVSQRRDSPSRDA
jgi:hypothetical protein